MSRQFRGEMSMDKLEFVKSYINRCDEVILSGCKADADKLQDEIIGIFESEITDIKNMLDNYSWAGFYDSNRQVDFIGDIKLIKQKLINYMVNLQEKQNKIKYELELARLKQPRLSAHAEANPTQTATVTSYVNITIEQAIKQLDEIPENILSNIERDILKELIFSLEGSKAARDKSKFWDKAKEILKFIADKGADTAIATLPYIIASLNSINVG